MNPIDILQNAILPLQTELQGYPRLWGTFRQCFLSTIETTVSQDGNDTFIITGDIHAMWLRDSTAQVLHYMRFADQPEIAHMIEGLISRQADCILRDPYANAYNREQSDYKPFEDFPRASDWVWERKYEIDSLCYPLWLAEKYMDKTGSTAFLTPEFAASLKTILTVFRTEQNHASSEYLFTRKNCPPSDTLTHNGKGEPVGYTGMTWSGFRPSDDACKYGYLVPSNLFAARVLKAAERFAVLLQEDTLAAEAVSLRTEIENGIRQYAIQEHPVQGPIYAYEVDGLGNTNFMDDANVPSLLALPYLEVCDKEDAIYQNTRKFVLSKENPYYYQGSYAKGIGSPHTPDGYIWPISLCVQAMTSTDKQEIAGILNTLMKTHAGTEFMHESFDPNNPAEYTRSWFAWANSMFGEFIYRLYEDGSLSEILTLALASS